MRRAALGLHPICCKCQFITRTPSAMILTWAATMQRKLPSSGAVQFDTMVEMNQHENLPGVRVAHIFFALGFGVPSVLLGLLFLGSAGLAVSGTPMILAWSFWSVGVVAACAGVVLAVQRFSFAALFGLCCVPLALAVVTAHVALRFGQ